MSLLSVRILRINKPKDCYWVHRGYDSDGEEKRKFKHISETDVENLCIQIVGDVSAAMPELENLWIGDRYFTRGMDGDLYEFCEGDFIEG